MMKYTTFYESIVLDCIAFTKLPTDERMKALEFLLDKYSPQVKLSGCNIQGNHSAAPELFGWI